MQTTQLEQVAGTECAQSFTDSIRAATWYLGAPGGFVTNSPQRKVTAFGDGSGINDQAEFTRGALPTTHWTAKMNASNISLHTKPEPMPTPLRRLIPHLRRQFQQEYPDAVLTPHTFSIAVCNYYTDPDMNIAAHTDCNPWYPTECSAGPVFASITLYPEGPPERDSHYARFSIRPEGQPWTPLLLRDSSVLIMPSGILHRVQPHKKCDRHAFRPRINITFRSTFPPEIDPLMHRMAVSNHTRYYRIPHAISYPDDTDPELLEGITRAYNQFAERYRHPPLQRLPLTGGKSARKSARSVAVTDYKKNGFPTHRITTNMVCETFLALLHQ
jgi:hypothetical protein